MRKMKMVEDLSRGPCICIARTKPQNSGLPLCLLVGWGFKYEIKIKELCRCHQLREQKFSALLIILVNFLETLKI